jgi:hypothetical protein
MLYPEGAIDLHTPTRGVVSAVQVFSTPTATKVSVTLMLTTCLSGGMNLFLGASTSMSGERWPDMYNGMGTVSYVKAPYTATTPTLELDITGLVDCSAGGAASIYLYLKVVANDVGGTSKPT